MDCQQQRQKLPAARVGPHRSGLRVQQLAANVLSMRNSRAEVARVAAVSGKISFQEGSASLAITTLGSRLLIIHLEEAERRLS